MEHLCWEPVEEAGAAGDALAAGPDGSGWRGRGGPPLSLGLECLRVPVNLSGGLPHHG